MNTWIKWVAGALVLAALAGVYAWLHESGTLTTITDRSALHAWVVRIGAWGPVLIVGRLLPFDHRATPTVLFPAAMSTCRSSTIA